MSNPWHWFVIIGTIGSLIGVLLFLLSNRRINNPESGATTGHDYDGIQEYDNPLPMWWVGMFVLSIIFAAGYLAWFPGLGNYQGTSEWTSASQWQAQVDAHDARFAPVYARLAALSEEEAHADREAQQVGRRLFINNCASCHGVTAQGAFGFPNLTDDEWLWGSDHASVVATIRQGRQAAMPAWGPALGEQGVTNVANYVLQISGGAHDPALAEQGAAQFQVFCTACHGVDGSGNPALGAPNLTNDSWLYGSTLDEISHTIRNGRNGHMPAQEELLSSDQVQILAAYVTSLAAKQDQ